MAAYSHLLGRHVTVQYRAGEIVVPASGVFVGDSGRSIFLEQHVEQRGRMNYFRWEIPYRYIHRVEDTPDSVSEAGEAADEAADRPVNDAPLSRAAAAGAGPFTGGVAGGEDSALPFPSRRKTA